MIINNKQILVFKSKPENIRLVESFIDELCDYFNIHNNYFANILMSVVEACQNAIYHGNKLNENKDVIVEFYTKEGFICFSVTDQGEGFNPNEIPDPTNPENSDEIGRGLYIMKSLSDKIEFSNNGRTVELCFSISTINKELFELRTKELEKHFQSNKTEIKKEK